MAVGFKRFGGEKGGRKEGGEFVCSWRIAPVDSSAGLTIFNPSKELAIVPMTSILIFLDARIIETLVYVQEARFFSESRVLAECTSKGEQRYIYVLADW